MSFSPDQVARFPTLTDEDGNEMPGFAEDGKQVRDMLIPLGRYAFARQVAAAHVDELNERWHYTCKNFKDGNCSIYETRPNMCRNFPLGELCEFADCEWDKYSEKARNKRLRLVQAAPQ